MNVVRGIRREYPDSPIMGVGGVVFQDDLVLLAKRAKEPGKGTWTLPGGVVELGETLEDALRREIEEEISVIIKICGLVRVVDRIIRDESERIRYHYVIADFWGYPISGKVRPDSDVSEAKYVSLDEIHRVGLHYEVLDTILLAAEMRSRATVSAPFLPPRGERVV